MSESLADCVYLDLGRRHVSNHTNGGLDLLSRQQRSYLPYNREGALDGVSATDQVGVL